MWIDQRRLGFDKHQYRITEICLKSVLRPASDRSDVGNEHDLHAVNVRYTDPTYGLICYLFETRTHRAIRRVQ